MKSALLAAVLQARAEKRPVAVITDLENGAQRLVFAGSSLDPDPDPDQGLEALPEQLADAVHRAFAGDRSQQVQTKTKTKSQAHFVQVFNPPLRLFIVGAVHIAQALAPMAALLGYEVTVVDPRRAFASAARFPGVRIDHAWPDEALTSARQNGKGH